LLQGDFSSISLSKLLGIKEKDVLDNLPHVRKSLGKGYEIISEPARCLDCGFVFRKRERVSTPGRCPVCRSEAIAPPLFGISAPSATKGYS
jgi:predicted Zn-ribbon and HTH transcriptional regulator